LGTEWRPYHHHEDQRPPDSRSQRFGRKDNSRHQYAEQFFPKPSCLPSAHNLDCRLDQSCRNLFAEGVDGHWTLIRHAEVKERIPVIRKDFQANAVEGGSRQLVRMERSRHPILPRACYFQSGCDCREDRCHNRERRRSQLCRRRLPEVALGSVVPFDGTTGPYSSGHRQKGPVPVCASGLF
jgi:hypothetical protein